MSGNGWIGPLQQAAQWASQQRAASTSPSPSPLALHQHSDESACATALPASKVRRRKSSRRRAPAVPQHLKPGSAGAGSTAGHSRAALGPFATSATAMPHPVPTLAAAPGALRAVTAPCSDQDARAPASSTEATPAARHSSRPARYFGAPLMRPLGEGVEVAAAASLADSILPADQSQAGSLRSNSARSITGPAPIAAQARHAASPRADDWVSRATTTAAESPLFLRPAMQGGKLGSTAQRPVAMDAAPLRANAPAIGGQCRTTGTASAGSAGSVKYATDVAPASAESSRDPLDEDIASSGHSGFAIGAMHAARSTTGARSALIPAGSATAAVDAPRRLRVHCATWNLASSKDLVSDDLAAAFLGLPASHLPSSVDDRVVAAEDDPTTRNEVVVIGTQENARPADWLNTLLEVLTPRNYVLVPGGASMLAAPNFVFSMTVAVFVHTAVAHYVSGVQVGHCAAGLNGMAGNKGACAVSMTVAAGTPSKTSFLFICAHLEAHQDRVERRNRNVARIMSRLELVTPASERGLEQTTLTSFFPNSKLASSAPLAPARDRPVTALRGSAWTASEEKNGLSQTDVNGAATRQARSTSAPAPIEGRTPVRGTDATLRSAEARETDASVIESLSDWASNATTAMAAAAAAEAATPSPQHPNLAASISMDFGADPFGSGSASSSLRRSASQRSRALAIQRERIASGRRSGRSRADPALLETSFDRSFDFGAAATPFHNASTPRLPQSAAAARTITPPAPLAESLYDDADAALLDPRERRCDASSSADHPLNEQAPLSTAKRRPSSSGADHRSSSDTLLASGAQLGHPHASVPRAKGPVVLPPLTKRPAPGRLASLHLGPGAARLDPSAFSAPLADPPLTLEAQPSAASDERHAASSACQSSGGSVPWTGAPDRTGSAGCSGDAAAHGFLGSAIAGTPGGERNSPHALMPRAALVSAGSCGCGSPKLGNFLTRRRRDKVVPVAPPPPPPKLLPQPPQPPEPPASRQPRKTAFALDDSARTQEQQRQQQDASQPQQQQQRRWSHSPVTLLRTAVSRAEAPSALRPKTQVFGDAGAGPGPDRATESRGRSRLGVRFGHNGRLHTSMATRSLAAERSVRAVGLERHSSTQDRIEGSGALTSVDARGCSMDAAQAAPSIAGATTGGRRKRRVSVLPLASMVGDAGEAEEGGDDGGDADDDNDLVRDISVEYDVVILLGDLNYRLDSEADVVIGALWDAEEAVKGPQTMAQLFKDDQLQAVMSRKHPSVAVDPVQHVLTCFAEATATLPVPGTPGTDARGPASLSVNSAGSDSQQRNEGDGGALHYLPFAPTYKLHTHSNVYKSSRVPSWTDRILWRCNYSYGGPGEGHPVAVPLEYADVPDMYGSDHRAVVLTLDVGLKHTDAVALDAVMFFAEKRQRKAASRLRSRSPLGRMRAVLAVMRLKGATAAGGAKSRAAQGGAQIMPVLAPSLQLADAAISVPLLGAAAAVGMAPPRPMAHGGSPSSPL